jgi:hypothetical protein
MTAEDEPTTWLVVIHTVCRGIGLLVAMWLWLAYLAKAFPFHH